LLRKLISLRELGCDFGLRVLSLFRGHRPIVTPSRIAPSEVFFGWPKRKSPGRTTGASRSFAVKQ
jgi:hypothetical protein